MVDTDQPGLDLITQLAKLHPIKTWSLLVTVFGDKHRAGIPELSGSELKDLLEPIGIRPEAIRVALHRLRKDGWIVSQKTGRETFYSLSPSALKLTRSAYEDVYLDDVKYADGWSLATFPNQEVTLDIGLNISKQLWLIPNCHSGDMDQALISQFDPDQVPNWLCESVMTAGNERVAEQLSILAKRAVHFRERLSPQNTIVVGMLILHQWRRLALRDETWFHIWLKEDGALARCQQNVISALEQMQFTKIPS